ncbi:hypothetical protein B0H17DRAFT_1152375 [Mycena rosella]|uniref:Uncharacterized protein n=1 Tax=Mycena rosella TaxID=1033263 RepID=A0AAD7FDW1_MYCRO|nr:hypothetical protein B0H17DRAFT_1152375 [Mycena rosella]
MRLSDNRTDLRAEKRMRPEWMQGRMILYLKEPTSGRKKCKKYVKLPGINTATKLSQNLNALGLKEVVNGIQIECFSIPQLSVGLTPGLFSASTQSAQTAGQGSNIFSGIYNHMGWRSGQAIRWWDKGQVSGACIAHWLYPRSRMMVGQACDQIPVHRAGVGKSHVMAGKASNQIPAHKAGVGSAHSTLGVS